MLPLGGAAFLLFGFVLVLLGVCQPGIAASLELDNTRFGMLGSALSAGIGVSVVAAGWLVDHYPRRPILLASALLTGAALATVDGDMSFARALAHMALVGAGCGIYDTLFNTVTVERFGADSVRPMSLLHAAVPLGAVVAPWLVHQAGGSSAWVAVSQTAGACYFALALCSAFVPLPAPAARARPHESARATTSVFASAPFLALYGVAFAYIGIEAALTLFATPYAIGALGLGEADGGRAISAFWLGIGLGRMLLIAANVGMDARVMAVSGVASAALLCAGVALGVERVDWMLGACGLAVSIVFPLMIALAGHLAPDAPGRAVGLVAGIGSIGGFALPWLTGAIADAAGSALAFGSLAGWCAAIGVAAFVAHRANTRSA